MKFLPTPPTDNLYKFAAITGLWMMIAVVVFFSWIGYLRFQNDEDFKRLHEYHYSKSRVEEAIAALDSLKAGRAPEKDFSGMPVIADPAEKERFLRIVLKNNMESVRQNEYLSTKKIGGEFNLMEAAGFYWLMPPWVAFGVFLFYCTSLYTSPTDRHQPLKNSFTFKDLPHPL